MHQIFEESQNLLMPFNKILKTNMETFDKLRDAQTKLVAELLQDSVDHMSLLAQADSDVSKVIEKQQNYWERVSAKCEKTFELNCELLSKAQTDMGTVMDEAKVTPIAAAAKPDTASPITTKPSSTLKPSATAPSAAKNGKKKVEVADKSGETDKLEAAALKATSKAKPAAKKKSSVSKVKA